MIIAKNMKKIREKGLFIQVVLAIKWLNLFYARFWGRMDVYAKRYEKKDTKEAGYYPQCYNFWKDVCPKKYGHKIKCKDCLHQAYKQLTKNDILNHLLGKSYNGSDVIGIYPLLKR